MVARATCLDLFQSELEREAECGSNWGTLTARHGGPPPGRDPVLVSSMAQECSGRSVLGVEMKALCSPV